MNIFLGYPPENIIQWIIDKKRPELRIPLCFEAVDAGATIALNCNGNNLKTATFQTSTDGQNWSDYTYATDITLENTGDKVYFKAKEDNTKIERDYNNYLQFTSQSSNKVNVSGNVMSLLSPRFSLKRSVSSYCFNRLFEGCTNIFDCSSMTLPATTLAESCYQSMFSYCTSLTYTPELPATTLADNCCYSMFSGCSNIEAAPYLPATTLANGCYSDMFRGCVSLTYTPDLPATTLADSCYTGMFFGCFNLTQAPAIKSYDSASQYAFDNMLDEFDWNGGSWGQLSYCNWPDLTLSEAESMVLNNSIFGYGDSNIHASISITCKDGSATVYYDSGKSSWVFER